MYLTNGDERVYNGERGWANQTCMKILVKLGELFNASKLIPIDSAHVSGVSYKTLGDAPVEYLETLANADGKVKVSTTLNPQGFDMEYLGKKLPTHLRERQIHILKQFERMGLTQSLTCTPYYLKKPRPGSHHAWAESSSVVYANSVLGAWTNREGGPSALAAAIVGKTPDYGVHKAENRQANVLICLEEELRNETEFGALGICLGKILGDRIPSVQGLKGASFDRLKQFSAAIATTGMANMFHYDSRLKHTEIEKVSVEASDVQRSIEELSTASTVNPDLVFVGCPHCSPDEIKQIAQLMDGKRVKDGVEFWVCTSQCVKENARSNVERIEKGGGHVLAGVCTIVSWTEELGIRTIMTNSAKTAYYAPMLNKAETILAPLEECVKTAVRG